MKRLLLSWVSAELLETIGLWLIIGGLIGEAALVFSILETSFEKPLTFLFTLAIAAGVWIEYVGSDDISSEKDARIAEAKARSLEAQLALEKFRKPWELPVWNLPEYEKLLTPFEGTAFLIHVIDVIDQRQMAVTLRQAFSWAKWEPHSGSGQPMLSEGITDEPPWITGVDVRINDTRVIDWRPAADAIAQVFALSEIEVTVHETNGVQPDAIHVFIGRKA